MKIKITLFVVLAFFNFSAYSQSKNYFELAIGWDDTQVIKYFDSLYSKFEPDIKREVSDIGDLIIFVRFAIKDEPQTGGSGLAYSFKRYEGVEICYRQVITGQAINCHGNLNFIKDNFRLDSNNTWVIPMIGNPQIKVKADFKVKENKFYSIVYELM